MTFHRLDEPLPRVPASAHEPFAQLSILAPASLKQQLVELSRAENRTLSRQVVHLLRQVLAEARR
jgi:hypothetical protein